MKVLEGTAVSSGLVRGLVCLYSDQSEETVPHYTITDNQISNEIARLQESFRKTQGSMQKMIKTAEKIFDKQAVGIFNVHLMMLKDEELLRKIISLIKEKKINAEHAVHDVFETYINLYNKKQLHFKELAQDFLNLKERILSSFSGLSGHFECSVGERQRVVVAAQKLTPYMVLNIPRKNVLAFITQEGGYTTHAMILARSLGIPVIFNINVKENMRCMDRVIVDGFSGKVIVSPDKRTENYYSQKIEKHKTREKVCAIKGKIVSKTASNIRIKLKLNISTPGELEMIKDFNHDGIGLLRTEFLFLERNHPPSREEQFNMYKLIMQKAANKPVVVRLLDIGSDKLPLFINLPQQINPDLEIKGARAVEIFYDLYLTQVKAILRAAKGRDLRILYPMVTDESDIIVFKKLISRAKKELNKEKEAFSKKITEGIMIEIPSAALRADVLLPMVDFANIGSNDLLQYTLAAYRGNALVEKRYHILHPSLVKLFEIIIKAGKKEKKEICLCGEISSFEEFYPLFLKLGLRSFSVAVAKFPHIKCELLHLNTSEKTGLVKKVYSAKSKLELDRLFLKTFPN